MSSDYDPEIEIIRAKKMKELRKRVMTGEMSKKEKSDREVLLSYLVDRGEEVLLAAEAQYPKHMALLIPKLAAVLRRGEISGKISGSDLMALLRSIGLRVRLETKISYEEHGKLMSLSDKLKYE